MRGNSHVRFCRRAGAGDFPRPATYDRLHEPCFLLPSHYGHLKLAMPQGFPTVLRPCSTLTRQFSGATSWVQKESLQKEGENYD
jgi:hypothetical protein